MVDSGAALLRMGVTPFMPSRKRMKKYHSSSVPKGFTPLATGCAGNSLNSACQCGFTLQLISKQPPIQSRNSFCPFSMVGSTV